MNKVGDYVSYCSLPCTLYESINKIIIELKKIYSLDICSDAEKALSITMKRKEKQPVC